MLALFSTANHRVSGEGGWGGGTVVCLLGTANVDAGAARPDPGARLRVINLLGTVNVRLPPGCPVAVGGLSLLGTLNGLQEAREEAAVRVRVFNLLGTVNVSR
jgi:hypothetical protein